MLFRDRRNTNLAENLVMATLVTINFTLDNAGILEVLKDSFKN